MKTIKFGIIGCGFMAREFASAVARWCNLLDMNLRPEIISICNRTLSSEKINWFSDNFDSIQQITDDYRQLLANPKVDAVYCAVPHNMHSRIYCATIEAGKHLLGENPFGIDLKANEEIIKCARAHPDILVKCASQYIYYPAVQRIFQMFEQQAFGRIIEVESGFLHSSDLNPQKPINWKRMIEYNGEYGVMGDLGVHVAIASVRPGWSIENVTAICSNILPKRPDDKGRLVECPTWDNATLLSQMREPETNVSFPWTLKLGRIMPGEKNTWYLNIKGTKACARFSLKNPKSLQILDYKGGEQVWQNIDMGFETAYKTITGEVFDFGAGDAFLQMLAAFIYELDKGKALNKWSACPSMQETNYCHRLFTAALQSHKNNITVEL